MIWRETSPHLRCELADTPLAQVEVCDPRFTLDQIAERFRYEVDPDAVVCLPAWGHA